MSVHSSLRATGGSGKHRSVLKRYERLKALKDKGLWSEEKTVLGLLKVKQQRVKVKKEKAASDAVVVPGAAATASASAKPAEGAKAPKK